MLATPPPIHADPAVPELEGSPLSHDERKRVLSAVRLKLTLTVFVIAVLLVFSSVIYFGVSRIFDWLTPAIRHDLQHKAQRGALELAQTAQLGIVVHDAKAIASACSDYLKDPDVISLVVLDDHGKRLFQHGTSSTQAERVFRQSSGKAHDIDATYAAWAPSYIESVEVGRVALVLSTARLEAGMQLRRDILAAAAVVCLLALALCLLFVNLYIGPILRVTGEAFVRLEHTTEAALAAARLKSQFLANMSHEIRTPMNGIVAVLDLLNRTALTSKQQRFAQTIEGSARTLLTVIDDILDFSKLEAGKYVLRMDSFEIRAMIQDVAELLAPKAHSKGVEIIQRVDTNVPYSIYGDVDRVRQVITNLIGNAIKFTDVGHVVLRVSIDSKTDAAITLRFSIQDTGMGIARDDQTKLFGVFSQVDGSLTRKHGGTGLGLAICKRLAEAMGGTIGVDSEPDKGSTFWFTIATREGELTEPGEGQQPRNARVLVVAKDDAQRDAMCELVQHWGMRYAGSDSPEHALELIMNADPHPFDVAVVDGAFDVTTPASRALFHLCTAENLPLIRLLSTGQTSDLRSEERRQLCLSKPVRVSELYNGIVALLDGIPLVQQRRTRHGSQADDDSSSLEPRTTLRGTVLIVDDNEINRAVAADLLTELGYAFELACNGVEALAKVQAGRFGAILMDCQMPEMDGYEATRRIRQLPGSLAKIPIIALTAHAMAGDRDRVLQAGMDDYTAKPVRVRALDRVLARWVQETTPVVSLEPKAPPPAEQRASNPAPVAGGNDSGEAPEAPEPEWVLDPTIPRSPRVIELFLKGVPEQLQALSQAAAAGELERVQQLAHKVKGGCLSLGAAKLAATAFTVERAAASGRLDEPALAELAPRFAAVSELLMKSQVVPSERGSA